MLAALVSVLGWVANYILSGQDERRKKQLDASLGYLQSQLEELYGPLAFLIQASRRSQQDLHQALGRTQVFQPGVPLEGDDLKTWLFWIENDIFPRNDKIKELLINKTHLIPGEQVPQSYMDFLEHHNSWKINHLRWQKDNIPYSWHSNRDFPDQFEQDVLDSFENLKSRHARMIGERHVKAESLKPLQNSAAAPAPPQQTKEA